MTQDNQLQKIIQKLERMDKRFDGVDDRLETMDKANVENFKEVKKSIRGLKLKATRTWNILYYFTKDADERIVKVTRKVDTIEEALGITHKN